MKVFSSTVRLATTKKTEEVKITDQVEAVVHESGVSDGIVHIFTGHTTASLHLNNADRDLEADFHDFLNELVPNKPTYRHNKGDYGKNADAHFKSLLVGNGVTIQVTRGKLSLGQWQAIYFSEFDGPRKRLVSIKVIGGGKKPADE
ncbi:MAG: YjbQ family protein [Deltaproteobacteria bacterium]|nr:YjbQ family protein [Deltaproteobacteria bacterium]